MGFKSDEPLEATWLGNWGMLPPEQFFREKKKKEILFS